jgi:hypothetical protein
MHHQATTNALRLFLNCEVVIGTLNVLCMESRNPMIIVTISLRRDYRNCDVIFILSEPRKKKIEAQNAANKASCDGENYDNEALKCPRTIN